MIIKLNKFGLILCGRPAGKEAWLAAQAYTLSDKKPNEKIEVDFTGVQVLTPSWADEFLTQLKKTYPNDVALLPSDNPTVKAALEVIEEEQATFIDILPKLK